MPYLTKEEGNNMKKSIFEKKMGDPKFKAVYERNKAILSIGEKIAELRHKHKMTQLELAKKAHTSRSAIARYESGKYSRYNVSTLIRIAKALDTDLKVSFISFEQQVRGHT